MLFSVDTAVFFFTPSYARLICLVMDMTFAQHLPCPGTEAGAGEMHNRPVSTSESKVSSVSFLSAMETQRQTGGSSCVWSTHCAWEVSLSSAFREWVRKLLGRGETDKIRGIKEPRTFQE